MHGQQNGGNRDRLTNGTSNLLYGRIGSGSRRQRFWNTTHRITNSAGFAAAGHASTPSILGPTRPGT